MSTAMEWTPGPSQVTQYRNGMPYANVCRVSGPFDGSAAPEGITQMADFRGCLESTSFRVKDRAAFLGRSRRSVHRPSFKSRGFFDENGETFSFGWYGQYPSTILATDDTDGGEEKELSICDIIYRHILPGDVCQIGISGNEKLRYIGGEIHWVASKGVASFNGITEWSTRLTDTDLLKLADDFVQQVRAAL
jgi:hypothetical protein